MPHFHIEYSANLQEDINMDGLCDALREKAASIDAFPMAGVRVRAIRVDHYAIADGNPQHGFIDLSVRLREGRSNDVKSAAIAQIFEVLKTFVAPAMVHRSIALSAEIRDIDANMSPKFGNIRDYLEP